MVLDCTLAMYTGAGKGPEPENTAQNVEVPKFVGRGLFGRSV